MGRTGLCGPVRCPSQKLPLFVGDFYFYMSLDSGLCMFPVHSIAYDYVRNLKQNGAPRQCHDLPTTRDSFIA